MTSSQKVIKYFAIALAMFLIIFIFSWIYTIGTTVLESIGIIESNETLENMKVISNEISNIDELYIELKGTKLEIVSGDEFKVETNNSKIKYTANSTNKNIRVHEEGRFLFYSNSKNNSTVRITIPNGLRIENKLYIKTGAGNINIDNINTANIDFDLGAGEVNIKEIYVTEQAEINGGVGKISIQSGYVNNLNVKMGVGEFNINALLTGKSIIEGGVGEFNLNLEDSIEDYTFKLSKGLGEIKVNGKDYSSDSEIGEGKNKIYVTGGVGEITISTNESKTEEETSEITLSTVNEE